MLAVLVVDPGYLPDVLIPTFVVLILLSLPLAAAGVMCAAVGVLRREGGRAVAGLGLSVVAVLPVALAAAIGVAAVSVFD
jgi:hypothetical protein